MLYYLYKERGGNMKKTLRQWRRELEYSIQRLADESGITFATIQRWETGKGLPLVTNALEVANVLGIQVEEIDWEIKKD